MPRQTCSVVFKTLLIGCVIGAAARVSAQEAALDDKPIAADAENLELPSTEAFEAEEAPEPGPWSLREAMKESDPFFRDLTVKINLRNYYFARQDGADAPGNDLEKISWAQGGSFLLKSGKLLDVFSVGTELFTSQHLYGPEDKDGALILEPGQDSYTVLGVVNPRFEYEGHTLSLFRQRHELPYVNSQENRMTPNTFESYSYGYFGEGEAPPLQVGIGYLDKIKKRNSDQFVSMSEGAGVAAGERGMPWLGARVRPLENLKLVAINFVGIDFLNTVYTDLEYGRKFSDDWGIKTSAQFSEQRSIGDDLLTGREVSATMWGVQQAISYRKFLVRAALTVNDEGTSMRSPWGSYPGYNSSIVEDFNRAGEIAWKVGISYDFSGVGIEGLSAYADFIQGNGAVNDSKESLLDKNETDVNIDYRIKEGWLKNFWLRLRGGWVHEETVGTTQDYRVIVNYDIPVV